MPVSRSDRAVSTTCSLVMEGNGCSCCGFTGRWMTPMPQPNRRLSGHNLVLTGATGFGCTGHDNTCVKLPSAERLARVTGSACQRVGHFHMWTAASQPHLPLSMEAANRRRFGSVADVDHAAGAELFARIREGEVRAFEELFRATPSRIQGQTVAVWVALGIAMSPVRSSALW
jgi:hypothetical protein